MSLASRAAATTALVAAAGLAYATVEAQWFTLRPLLEAGQTLTSKLGGSEINISYGDPLHGAAMAGLGLLLLAIVPGITIVATLLTRGKEGKS